MSAPARQPIDAARRSIYGKIEVAKKALGLDDDTYRGILRARYGKASRTALSRAELGDLVEHFQSLGFRPTRAAPKRAGSRPAGTSPQEKKALALWLVLWNLAVVESPTNASLAAFAKPLTHRDALQFASADELNRVIEALKSWIERKAFKVPDDATAARRAVVHEQWRKLHELGAVQIGDTAALDAWLQGNVSPAKTGVDLLSDAQLDVAANRLGAWLRRATAEKESKA